VDLAVDMHGRLTRAQAIAVSQALAGSGLMFIEDPIPPDSVRAQADLARRLRLPLALGERLTGLAEHRDLLNSGAADLLRLDIGLAGGLTGSRKIATLAEAHGVDLAPHHGPDPIALAATLHLDAAIPNFAIQSYLNDHLSPWSAIVKNMVAPEGGYLPLPQGAGLGIELDEDYVYSHRGTPAQLAGPPEGSDGSVGYP
jgi:galactonate dehydratase